MSSLELLQKEVVGRSWYRADLDRGGGSLLLLIECCAEVACGRCRELAARVACRALCGAAVVQAQLRGAVVQTRLFKCLTLCTRATSCCCCSERWCVRLHVVNCALRVCIVAGPSLRSQLVVLNGDISNRKRSHWSQRHLPRARRVSCAARRVSLCQRQRKLLVDQKIAQIVAAPQVWHQSGQEGARDAANRTRLRGAAAARVAFGHSHDRCA